ncbi:hypothetical protein LV89_00218 [Arcicella aurantiaca]|uniref:Uncharacterized protein n=1 Tax=Arcicella aurantiaca TaxID=591202 RepID=A0A316EIJ0_9BACT|nr:hypothetical protein [Arcicella aurantiaca]PWK29378.1 hypothetical protein LV89_00218 [Arcicella aurantiaca]
MRKTTKTTLSYFSSKLLDIILYIMLIVLLTKVIYVHSLAIKMSFCISSIDTIHTYLNLYNSKNFPEILGIILVCITAQIYISQLEIANATLENNIFNDKFNEWSAQIESAILEKVNLNEKLCKQFSLKRRHLFAKLFLKEMKIKNKNDLYDILSIYQNDVYYFETFEKKFENGKNYQTENTPRYSYDTFQFLFLLTIEKEYDDLRKDLKEWYEGKLPLKKGEILYELVGF